MSTTNVNEVSPGDLERDEMDCDGNCSECDDVNNCALTELIFDVPLPGDRGVQEDPEAPLAACDAQCAECNGAGECNLDDTQHEQSEAGAPPCPSDEGCRICAHGAECNDMRDPDEVEGEVSCQ